jgi:hypothetical protein
MFGPSLLGSVFFRLFGLILLQIALSAHEPLDAEIMDGLGARSRCQGVILELLKLPAKGRIDAAQLVHFDRALRKKLINISQKKSFSLKIMSQELGFHIFPQRLDRVKASQPEEEIIGFDFKGLYVQVLSSKDTIAPSGFSRQYLRGPNYNSDREINLIQLPNLFKPEATSMPHVDEFILRFGSHRSGDEVMGYLLLHEWINSQQTRGTSWGRYLDELRRIQNRPQTTKADFTAALLRWGHLSLIKMAGSNRLAAGALLLNEIQSQSIVPLPGFRPMQIRRLWLQILKQLPRSDCDWDLITKNLKELQSLIISSAAFSQDQRTLFALPSTLQSALEWLWRTKHFAGSKRSRGALGFFYVQQKTQS